MLKQRLWTSPITLLDFYMTVSAEANQICRFIRFSPISVIFTIWSYVMHLDIRGVSFVLFSTYDTSVSISYQSLFSLLSPISSSIRKFRSGLYIVGMYVFQCAFSRAEFCPPRRTSSWNHRFTIKACVGRFYFLSANATAFFGAIGLVFIPSSCRKLFSAYFTLLYGKITHSRPHHRFTQSRSVTALPGLFVSLIIPQAALNA